MNDGFEYREQVGPASAGQTVLAHLARRYRHSSEGVWRERLARGEVTIEAVRARADQRLVSGTWLVWRRPPWEEPPVPLSFAVLYRDDQLLAVAKPRGLPCVPNGGFLTHTLLHLVRRVHPEVTPLHRLGRGTSGLVLFARTLEARRLVAAAWRAGRVEKTYRALVSGIPAEAEFTVRLPIGPVPHPRLGWVFGASVGGDTTRFVDSGRESGSCPRSAKPALTHVRVLAVRDGNAVVEARIPTGRPHQIRIHTAAAGHPLVGDPLYAPGGGLTAEPGLPGDGGYRLHAYRLRLVRPVTGAELDVECALPPELRV